MKTWLITGCSSGIGRGVARAALAKGDNVIVTARSVSGVEDFVSEYPDRAFAVALDLTNPESIDIAFRTAMERFGRIDVLVNNAGYGYRSAVEEGENEAVRALYDTNLFGPLALIKKVLPQMRERKEGTIVNVTSIAAVRSAVGSAYYASSKAAMKILTNGLQKELAPLGIRVLEVQPGAFQTRFYDASLKGTQNKIGDYEETVGKSRPENLKPVQRPGDPEKGGQIIVDTVLGEKMPKTLYLGDDALRAVTDEYTALLKELVEWAPISHKSGYNA